MTGKQADRQTDRQTHIRTDRQSNITKAEIMNLNLFLLVHLGLMADKLGNYTAAFLMAGGFGVIASIIPFILLCVERESEQIMDQDVKLELDQIHGEDIDFAEQEAKPRSFSQESRTTHRSKSFITAMKSPLY